MSSDFTLSAYREALKDIGEGFFVASFRDLGPGDNFILLRHDIEISLDRALSMAKVEKDLGLRATYFINPLASMYSIFEKENQEKIQEIERLGHELGLHFDSSSHQIYSRISLEEALKFQSGILELAGIRAIAFSFHNPTELDLTYNDDSYAGLVNAYSKTLFSKQNYVSDSNGYWRFETLSQALEKHAGKDFIQVLTHPEWWQDQPMPPRMRIVSSLLERAKTQIRAYDSMLIEHGRTNVTGMPPSLESLALLNGAKFQALDILWNMGRLETLFVELWRLHESQINKMCKAQFRKVWGVSAQDVNAFFASDGVRVDGWKLFELVFEDSWLGATGSSETEHIKWVQVRNQLIHARGSIRPLDLEAGVAYLSDVIVKVADWGLESKINYDGVAPLGSIGLPTYKSAEGSLYEELDLAIDSMAEAQAKIGKRWRSFKAAVFQRRETHE
jgi:hypothetical protein